jgi:thiamine-monophosphate kinase
MKLQVLGEDRLLAQLLPGLAPGQSVIAGAGDDCAIVEIPRGGKHLVLKTDCVVEGVHFSRRANPVDIGWKAMMRPLSDFAAVSAVPQFALITLMLSKRRRIDWVMKLYRGLNRAAARFRVGVVGGELSNSPGPVAISVSVAGVVEKNRWVGRASGKVGDALFVTGRLGCSIKAKHLRFVPRIVESRWLTENFRIHAMMDLSDGLGADLPRLARASKVGFKIDIGKLPLTRGATVRIAISDGEDYELLFALSPRDRGRLQQRWANRFSTVPLTFIGNLATNTKDKTSLTGGYVHFK